MLKQRKRLGLLAALLGSSLLASAQLGTCTTQLDLQGFNLTGSASPDGSCVTLTPNQSSLMGSAWHKSPLDLRNDFDFTFSITQSGYADGMIFVLQNDGNNINSGIAGGSLGYYHESRPIPYFNQSVAVEFDIYDNGPTLGDNSSSHIALVKNKNPMPVEGPFQVSPYPGNGYPATVRFVWNAAQKSFTLYRDGSLLFTHTEDLVASTFGGNPSVYFGFMAANGGQSARQSFCAQNLFVNTPDLARISYPGTPYCGSTGTITPTLQGLGGGVYSAGAGLAIDPVSGVVDLAASQAGVYTVTYAIGNGTCTQNARTELAIRPIRAMNAPGNHTFCAGANTTPVDFSGLSGISYTWSQDNPAIGLPASGSGNIPSFVAVNYSQDPATAMVTVRPAGGTGCSFKPDVFRVTVKPMPRMAGFQSFLVLCQGQTLNAGAFQGVLPGSSFSWTSSNPSVGLPASGTGNLPAVTLAGHPYWGDYTLVTVTPSANGCAGLSADMYIVANPAAGTISYSASSYCPVGTARVTQKGSPGGVYSASPAGLVIDAGTGTVNLAASLPGTYTVRYEIAPYSSDCALTATTTLTVKPTVTVSPVANQYFCDGTSTAPIAFPGTASSYNWSVANTAIGNLPASGSGTSLPSFTTVNNPGGDVSSMVYVTPQADADGCPGKTMAFRIQVRDCAITRSGDSGGGSATSRLSAQVTVGPNPASGTVRITYSGNATRLSLQVQDSYGRPTLAPRSFTGSSTSIDVSALLPGTYYVVLLDPATGDQVRQKLIRL